MVIHYLVEQWPVSKELVVSSLRDPGAHVDLVAHAADSFSVQIRTYSKNINKHFQKLNLPVDHYVKIVLIWNTDADAVKLFVGGQMLVPLASAPDRPLEITGTASRPVVVPGFSVQENVVLNLPFERWLFVETLSDLTKRLTSKRRYDGLRVSALVRQLLADGNPLLTQANRESRVSISFKVRKTTDWGVSGVVPEISWTALNPTQDDESVDLRLADFLSTRVLLIDGTYYEVLDVISAVANVMGGVHLNKGQSQADKDLRGLQNKINTPAGELILAAMLDIGLVVLYALQPLAKKICDIEEAHYQVAQ